MKGIDMKHCAKCNTTKDESEFYSNRAKADGLHIYCKECSKKAKNEWRAKNPEKVYAYDKQWQEANKDKKSKNYKNWQQNNRGTVNAYNAKRRALEKSSTPSWANLDAIKSLYNVAQYFNWISGGFVKHHVDHIVPLQGKTVCGLHVENNLQILIDKDNLRKSNHHG
jgi:hypothetical protein